MNQSVTHAFEAFKWLEDTTERFVVQIFKNLKIFTI